jgi:hypothetical protein
MSKPWSKLEYEAGINYKSQQQHGGSPETGLACLTRARLSFQSTRL